MGVTLLAKARRREGAKKAGVYLAVGCPACSKVVAIQPKTLGREFCKVTDSVEEFAVILVSSNPVDRTGRILPARNAHEPISEAFFESKCAMPSVINHAVEAVRLGVILTEASEGLFIE
jgi:hypothetical protein